jgi:hypothetical protein
MCRDLTRIIHDTASSVKKLLAIVRGFVGCKNTPNNLRKKNSESIMLVMPA